MKRKRSKRKWFLGGVEDDGVDEEGGMPRRQRTDLETAERRRVLDDLFASHGDLQTLSAKVGRWVSWKDVAQIVSKHTGRPETSAGVRNSLMRLRRHGGSETRKPRSHNLCTRCGKPKLGHICARAFGNQKRKRAAVCDLKSLGPKSVKSRDTLVGAGADDFARNLAASAEHDARRPTYVAWPPLVCLTPGPPAPCRA